MPTTSAGRSRSARFSQGRSAGRSLSRSHSRGGAEARGASKSRGNGRSAAGTDLKMIIEMLMDDHRKVDKLFKKIEKMKKSEDESRYNLIREACEALTVHAELEEEMIYPAAREAVEEEDLVDEAEIEHQHIKELVLDLQNMSEDDPLCDAKATVLCEYVRHHVKEEEGQLFPKLRKAKPDLTGLYQQVMERRQELEQGQAAAGMGSRDTSARTQGYA